MLACNHCCIVVVIRQQVFLRAVHVWKRSSDLRADGSDGVRSESVSLAPQTNFTSPVSCVSSCCCIASVHAGGSVWSHSVLTPWRPNLTTETDLQFSLSESTNCSSFTHWYWCFCIVSNLSVFQCWARRYWDHQKWDAQGEQRSWRHIKWKHPFFRYCSCGWMKVLSVMNSVGQVTKNL